MKKPNHIPTEDAKEPSSTTNENKTTEEEKRADMMLTSEPLNLL